MTLYDRMHTDCGIIYVLKGIVALLFRALRGTVPPFEKHSFSPFESAAAHHHDNARPSLRPYFSSPILARSSNDGGNLAFYCDRPHRCATLSGALD